ncbi:MAG TPA: hypothetical protein VEB59_07380, partial [Gemmatimonadales bacterium]|nr:hypothetical protein [Gemmatimonadales bacterium]
MVNDNHNSDQEVLFSRLLDGRGQAADWRRLREATGGETGAAAWDRLIASAGDQDVLGDVVAVAAGRAELTDVASNDPIPFPAPSGRRHDRAVRAARLGWLVAACMALGMVSVALRPGGNGTATQNAGLMGTPALDAFSS